MEKEKSEMAQIAHSILEGREKSEMALGI